MVAVVLGSASPAAAHAELLSTDPIGGAVLQTPPHQIALRFSDAVELNAGSIRVYDQTGDRLRIGSPEHPGGAADQVTASLPDLDRGAYVVTWRVVSADSHPVHGAFTIRIGSAATVDTQPLTERLLAAEGGSTAVGGLYGAARFLSFVTIAGLLGGTTFVVVIWPGGIAERRARRLVTIGWVTALLASVAVVLLQRVYAAGLGVGDVFDPSAPSDIVGTRFGNLWLARIVVLAAAGPLLLLVTTRTGAVRSWALRLLSIAAVVVLIAPAIAGHPGRDSPAAVSAAADATHLGAVCVWIGGLTMLLYAVLRTGVEDAPDVTRRFSNVAAVAVGVILVTGTYQGWRQSRSIDAVRDTTYGQLLLVKILLFAVLLGAALLSRSWVRRRDAGSPSLGRIRLTVGAEVAIAAVVMGATALLVNAVPAKTALAQPGYLEFRTNDVVIDLTVDPAKAGLVDFHLYTTSPAGSIIDIPEVRAELTLPGREIGPLAVPLQRAGPGHLAAYGFDVPIPGRWQVAVTARTSEVDQETLASEVRIR